METREERLSKIRELMEECLNKEDHEKFLKQYHDRLKACPIDLLGTEEGFKKVADLLEGMIWGDFV